MGQRVPFVVDVCPMTFEQLDLLLKQVSEGMDGSSDWPPPQEKECMVVATLNLLRLQVCCSLRIQKFHYNFQLCHLCIFLHSVFLLHDIMQSNSFRLFLKPSICVLSFTQPLVIRWIQRSWDWGLAVCCSTI